MARDVKPILAEAAAAAAATVLAAAATTAAVAEGDRSGSSSNVQWHRERYWKLLPWQRRQLQDEKARTSHELLSVIRQRQTAVDL